MTTRFTTDNHATADRASTIQFRLRGLVLDTIRRLTTIDTDRAEDDIVNAHHAEGRPPFDVANTDATLNGAEAGRKLAEMASELAETMQQAALSAARLAEDAETYTKVQADRETDPATAAYLRIEHSRAAAAADRAKRAAIATTTND